MFHRFKPNMVVGVEEMEGETTSLDVFKDLYFFNLIAKLSRKVPIFRHAGIHTAQYK